MFQVSNPAPDRLDLVIEGQINGDAMQQGLDDLLTACEGMEKGKMLYTIHGFAMPTPSAFAVEFSYLPKLFNMLGKFDRAAVVSDQAWIRTAAEIEGALIPGLVIKSFQPGQEAAAEKWLEEGDSEGGPHSIPV